MELTAIARSLAALGVVLALLWLGLWLIKRFGGHLLPNPARTQRRQLEILETLSLQGRHRLVRVRNGGEEHLVLLGQSTELLVSSSAHVPAPIDAENTP